MNVLETFLKKLLETFYNLCDTLAKPMQNHFYLNLT